MTKRSRPSQRTAREWALQYVTCPRCKAPAGEPCVGTRGPRKAMHAERHDAAIRHGAPKRQKWEDD